MKLITMNGCGRYLEQRGGIKWGWRTVCN